MKVNISLIIIIIIFFIILLIAYDKKNLQLFDHFYEDMSAKAYYKYNKVLKTPEYSYTQLSGYENGRYVNSLISKLEKKDKSFTASEKKFGKLKKKSANKSVVGSFILGDIHNYNKNNKDVAKIHYDNTLNRLTLYPLDVIDHNDNNIEPTPENMIDRIENFYLEQDINEAENIEAARNQIRNARAARAGIYPKKIENTKKINPKRAYYTPKKIKSDPQNVHDSTVTNQTKNKYDKIKTLNSRYPEQYTIQDLIESVTKDNDEKRAKKIIDVINKMKGSNIKLEDSEENILLNVWKRVNTKSNINKTQNTDDKNKSKSKDYIDNKKESFYKSLEDCIEKSLGGREITVCSTGRCSRIIDSLTLIDENAEISNSIQNTDMIRNEAMSKSYKILQDELNKAPQKMQELYNTGNTKNEDDVNKLNNFETKIKNKISKTLRSDYEYLPKTIIDNIIEDCNAGI